MGLQRIGMLLLGVGVFAGAVTAVATDYLDASVSADILLGSIGLVGIGVLVGALGVARNARR